MCVIETKQRPHSFILCNKTKKKKKYRDRDVLTVQAWNLLHYWIYYTHKQLEFIFARDYIAKTFHLHKTTQQKNYHIY